ncbi:MAG: exodeoxyribonuclease VII small subunit [Spirochaetes bacterium]|jgi:exodeoxyribonuclease VII small subunit|nr:exodeoxyribonuclease VII small subunit [Spirochaetota bacterium]
MQTFEDRLERLEALSEKIRTGDLGLDEAVQTFEEGMRLAKQLEKDLSKVERKVEILVNEPDQPDEEPVLELFPELSELAGEGKKSGGEKSSGDGPGDGGAGSQDS